MTVFSLHLYFVNKAVVYSLENWLHPLLSFSQKDLLGDYTKCYQKTGEQHTVRGLWATIKEEKQWLSFVSAPIKVWTLHFPSSSCVMAPLWDRDLGPLFKFRGASLRLFKSARTDIDQTCVPEESLRFTAQRIWFDHSLYPPSSLKGRWPQTAASTDYMSPFHSDRHGVINFLHQHQDCRKISFMQNVSVRCYALAKRWAVGQLCFNQIRVW